MGDEFTFIGPRILTALLTCQDPCPLGDLNEAAFDVIATMYMLDGLSELQMEMLRKTIETDVAIAIAALGVLGVVIVDQAHDKARLTDLGRFAIRRLRGMAEPGDPVLQVRITLRDVDDPRVWRQVLIPAADETKARLADVARVRTRMSYEYDFGDSWEHELVVEARTVAEDGQAYPACLAGEGACPPEDSGGAYGFAELKEVLAGPDSAERDEMREWVDEDYDPAHFDLTAVNAAVAAV